MSPALGRLRPEDPGQARVLEGRKEVGQRGREKEQERGDGRGEESE